MIYASTKFEVATSNGLGADTITRNMTDGRTDRQSHGRTTDRLWHEINIPYFSNKKAGIIIIIIIIIIILIIIIKQSENVIQKIKLDFTHSVNLGSIIVDIISKKEIK